MSYSYDTMHTLSELQHYTVPDQPITITSSQGDPEMFDFLDDSSVTFLICSGGGGLGGLALDEDQRFFMVDEPGKKKSKGKRKNKRRW